jgi:hypothetical protein
VMNQFSGWQSLQGVGGVLYAYAYFAVTHDFHYVEMAPNTFGGFGVNLYGHSTYMPSTSAYGVAVNWNITGIPNKATWIQNLAGYQTSLTQQGNGTCQDQTQLVGEVMNSPGGPVSFPFTLQAEISPCVQLSDACVAAYTSELDTLLGQFSNMINVWICNTQNCSFLNGQGAAINYNTLSVTFEESNNLYCEVQIYVEMDATLDTTAQNFAMCRAMIMNFMLYFNNWPNNPPSYPPTWSGTPTILQLVPGLNCPPVNFAVPQFSDVPQQCAAY